MWIARLPATYPHIHSPAKNKTFFYLDLNVKTDCSDSYLDWNVLHQPCPMRCEPERGVYFQPGVSLKRYD